MSGRERLEARVQELEMLLGFQDETIAKLNEVVLQFTGRVERLERELERLRAEVRDPEVGPQNDKPPHY